MYEKPTKVTIKADFTMCYTRVVNTIGDYLNDDYPYNEDLFHLLDICKQIDQELSKKRGELCLL